MAIDWSARDLVGRRARAAGGLTLPWRRRQLPRLGLVAAAAAGWV